MSESFNKIFKTDILLQNNLCEFTTRKHKLKSIFNPEKPVINAGFKDF